MYGKDNYIFGEEGACVACFSSTTLRPLVSREDATFFLHILLELPKAYVFERKEEESSSSSLFSKVQFCETCGVDLEKAKTIYSGLVEAAKQFRNIQSKITAAIQSKNVKVQVVQGLEGPEKCQEFLIGPPSKNFPLLVQDELPSLSERDPDDLKLEPQSPSLEVGGDVEEMEIKTEAESDADSLGDQDESCSISGDEETRSDPSLTGDESDGMEDEVKESESESEAESDESDGRKASRKANNFHCSKCKFSCRTNRGLTIHAARIHKLYQPKKPKRLPAPRKVGKFKCTEEDCGKSFTRHSTLQIHMSRHTQQPLFKCQLCEETFFIRSSLRSHEQKSHPELAVKHSKSWSERRYPCNLCPSILNSSSGLRHHKRIKHQVMKQEYPCPEPDCSKTFSKSDLLKTHLSREHGAEPSFKCDQCGVPFHSWKQKWRHQQKVHEGGLSKKPYVCESCGKAFVCLDYLFTHKSTAHRSTTSVSKPKTLPSGPPKICEICGKVFKSAVSLSVHRNVVHLKTALKAPCHLCSKRFIGQRQLQIHLYHHHHVGPKEYAVRPPKGEMFRCSVIGCRKKFYKDKTKLDKHVQEVHGEEGKKPPTYKCGICGKGFYHAYKFRSHEQMHESKESDVEYPCDICGKTFKLPTYVAYHKRYTHKVKVPGSWTKKPGKESENGVL